MISNFRGFNISHFTEFGFKYKNLWVSIFVVVDSRSDHVVSFNFLSFLSGQTERVSLKHSCVEISNSHQSWINNTSEHTSHVRVRVQ